MRSLKRGVNLSVSVILVRLILEVPSVSVLNVYSKNEIARQGM
ncbi:MAG: hypothetical protein ACW976_03390 [Candidatus Ranarchaeia archaeon]